MAIVYLRGLPWEATEDDVFSALRAMLPKQISILDLLLPLDSRARPSGDAYIELVPDLAAAEALRLLDGTKFSQRYLEARLSNVKERETARKRTEAAADRVAVLAKQNFLQSGIESRFEPSNDRREIVVLCHSVPRNVLEGHFELNNLTEGRVDLIARCASVALFYSHGVRKSVRLWILIPEAGAALCCDGSTARGLRPDERCLSAALKRWFSLTHPFSPYATPHCSYTSPALFSAALKRVCAGHTGSATQAGWRIYKEVRLSGLVERLLHDGIDPDGLEVDRKSSNGCGGSAQLLIAHEQGERAWELVERFDAEERQQRGTVLVLGDHLGFTHEEEQILLSHGGERCRLGPLPLLTSHCIVLAQNALDEQMLGHDRSLSRASE